MNIEVMHPNLPIIKSKNDLKKIIKCFGELYTKVSLHENNNIFGKGVNNTYYFYEVWYILKGQMEIHFDDISYNLEEDDLIILGKNIRYLIGEHSKNLKIYRLIGEPL